MAIADPVGRLARFSLFRGLSPQALRLIGDLAHETTYPVPSVIFQQGTLPSHFYLVLSGQVLETGTAAAGAIVIRLDANPGNVLGRWAVFNREAHQTTAIVVRDAAIMSIPLAEFQSLLARFPALRQRLSRSDTAGRLMGIPLFSCLTEEQLFHVADLVEVVEYAPGQVVYKRGDSGDAFYVIDTGRVTEQAGTLPPRANARYLTAGAFFGQEDLLRATTRQATAKAEARTTVFQFSASAFEWLRHLHPGFGRALTGFDPVPPLATVPLFANLTHEERRELAGFVGVAHLPRGEVVFYQGEVDATFYMLLEGQAVRYATDESRKARLIGPLNAGDAVGERYLFVEEPWGFTLRTTTRTTWLYLTREDLAQFLQRRPAIRGKLVPADRSMIQAKGKSFGWLALDEEELLRRRRHVAALFRRLFVWPDWLLWVAAVLLVAIPWARIRPGLSFLHLPGWAILALWALWCVVDYWNDYLVVTTKRVVYREKVVGLFESLFEVPLGKVQNVVVRQDFLGNLLGYGRLNVDTAATSGIRPLSFTFTRAPEAVKTLVFEEMERLRVGRIPQTRRAIRERMDAGMRVGLRPIVRKPAVPPAAVKLGQVHPGVLIRAYHASLGRLFWLEQRTEDTITWRKHPLRLIAKVGPTTLLAVLAVLVYSFLRRQIGLELWILLAALVPLALWWWWGWMDWGNDLYIVTRDRIIDTERLPLGLRLKKMEAPFDRVQNVTFELPNLIANLFNFGTVSIYTAGVEGKMDFQYVANPRKVQAEIFQRLAAYEEEQRRKQHDRTDLTEWFAVYKQTH